MALFTFPATFLPAALGRPTASGAPLADRRDALGRASGDPGRPRPAILHLGPQSRGDGELCGLDLEGWSRVIGLLSMVERRDLGGMSFGGAWSSTSN